MSSSDPQSVKFRILTYNVHKAIGGLDRKYRPDRVIDVIGDLAPDVALLQEVDDGVPRSRFHRQVDLFAEELNYPYTAFQHNVRVKEGSYGNAILSRYPIDESWDLDLKIPIKKRRQALIARIEIGAPHPSPIYLCNTHLGLAGIERKIQVRRLLGHEAVADVRPHVPLIVAGDLNDVWSSLAGQLMIPNGFHNASNYARTFPAFLPVRALDAIYYRGQLTLESCFAGKSDLARKASDHLPLVADFHMQPDH